MEKVCLPAEIFADGAASSMGQTTWIVWCYLWMLGRGQAVAVPLASLAKKTGLSVSTVIRSLNIAKAHNWIHIEEEHKPKKYKPLLPIESRNGCCQLDNIDLVKLTTSPTEKNRTQVVKKKSQNELLLRRRLSSKEDVRDYISALFEKMRQESLLTAEWNEQHIKVLTEFWDRERTTSSNPNRHSLTISGNDQNGIYRWTEKMVRKWEPVVLCAAILRYMAQGLRKGPQYVGSTRPTGILNGILKEIKMGKPAKEIANMEWRNYQASLGKRKSGIFKFMLLVGDAHYPAEYRVEDGVVKEARVVGGQWQGDRRTAIMGQANAAWETLGDGGDT